MDFEDSGEIAPSDSGEQSGITRRRALQVGAAVAGAGLIAACGSSGSGSSAPAGGGSSSTAAAGLPGAVAALPGGTPKKGGTLTMGVLTAGSAENLWPGTASVLPDWAHQYNLYNFLLYPGVNMSPLVPGLATSWESNADATVWTFHLRSGVTWHDGTPFSAKDAVYNFQLWTNPKANYSAAFLTGIVNTHGVKARDNLTVEVPLLRPIAQFPTILAWFNFGLVKDGTTAKERRRAPDRHRSVQVRVLHARAAERLRGATPTTGRRGSRTSTSWSSTRRSPTTTRSPTRWPTAASTSTRVRRS